MEIKLQQKQPVVLWEYQVTFENGSILTYKEWTDPVNGMVLNYMLVNENEENIDDESLIDLIQIKVEESLV